MALAVIPQCPLQITLMSVNSSLRDKKPVQEVLNKYKAGVCKSRAPGRSGDPYFRRIPKIAKSDY